MLICKGLRRPGWRKVGGNTELCSLEPIRETIRIELVERNPSICLVFCCQFGVGYRGENRWLRFLLLRVCFYISFLKKKIFLSGRIEQGINSILEDDAVIC